MGTFLRKCPNKIGNKDYTQEKNSQQPIQLILDSHNSKHKNGTHTIITQTNRFSKKWHHLYSLYNLTMLSLQHEEKKQEWSTGNCRDKIEDGVRRIFNKMSEQISSYNSPLVMCYRNYCYLIFFLHHTTIVAIITNHSSCPPSCVYRGTNLNIPNFHSEV